jgi:sigma-B regulation protein RsbU (phosphoserine phosphatase)
MAVGRTILRMEALDRHSPAQTLARLNRFVVHDVQSRLFLSAFVAQFDLLTGQVVFANAGHNPPYWIRNAPHAVETLAAPGILIGAMDVDLFADRECTVAPGDFLVFFTDGITEARDVAGAFLDEAPLEAVLASRRWTAADELLAAIIGTVETFVGEADQADDYTVVVVQRLP